MLIEGACHCRNITFTLSWEPSPQRIPARACGCSFCRKHGGVWTSNPNGSLTVSVNDSAQVSRYAFGTATAEFHVYTACGVVPVVTSRIDGRLYSVVSVNAFENVTRSMIDCAPAGEAKKGTNRPKTRAPADLRRAGSRRWRRCMA